MLIAAAGSIAAAGLILSGVGGLRTVRNGLVFYAGRAEGCSLEQALHPVNERVGPILKQVGAQIKPIETVDGLVRWDTPMGDWWAPDFDGLSYVMAEQSLDTYNLSEEGLGPDSVVIDAGANVGMFTRRALDSGVGLVVAVDPSPKNGRALRLNFEDEIRAGRVIVVEKGLWHEPDVLPMFVYDNSALDSMVMADRVESSSKPRRVEVPLETLDAIVADLGLDRVDLIKMDVEGAERNAIRGAVQTIRRHRPILTIAAENLPDDVRVIPEEVAAATPAYQVHSGECRVIDRFLIRPEALHFRPTQ